MKRTPHSDDIHQQATLPIGQNRRVKRFKREKFEYYYLQFLILFACTITFGLLPPLQPFSCLPVGRLTHKYAVILAGLAYPVGCSIALFLKCKSLKMLTLLSLVATAICVFLFYSALYSPGLPAFLIIDEQTPEFVPTAVYSSISNGTEYLADDRESSIFDSVVLHFNRNHSTLVSVLMVSCWVMFNLILSYVKTMVTICLNDRDGEEALFYVGLFSQMGSVLGSAFMFVAVNHLKWFKQN